MPSKSKHKPVAKRNSEVVLNPCNSLHIACLEGDVKRVNNFLQKGSFDVNAMGENGFSPLHFAANAGYFHICQSLIESNADPDLKTETGLTAIQLIQSHDFSEKPLYHSITQLLDNSYGTSIKPVVPFDKSSKANTKTTRTRTATANCRKSTKLQRSKIIKPANPPRVFSKSVSTGDILSSIKKNTIMQQLKASNSPAMKSFCVNDQIVSPEDTDSTSDSAKSRSALVSNFLLSKESDTGSSEFGDAVLFFQPFDFETELEQNPPKRQESSSCLGLTSTALRNLTCNVIDVMLLINENNMISKHSLEASQHVVMPPTSLLYKNPRTIGTNRGSGLRIGITVARLVKKLLLENGEYCRYFFMVYRFFLPPEELHEILQNKFKNSQTSSEDGIPLDSSSTKLTYRILKFYATWLSHFEDVCLFPALRREIASFVRNIVKLESSESSKWIVVCKKILTFLGKEFEFPLLAYPPFSSEKLPVLSDIMPRELALEFALFYKDLLGAIHIHELALFSKDQEILVFCPNVVRLFQQNDTIKRWIMSMIVMEKNAKLIAQRISYFIMLFQECLLLHNYQVSSLIAQALLATPVTRLTESWELLEETHLELLKHLLNALTQSMNYELFAYFVFENEEAIVYDLGIVLEEFICASTLVSKEKIDFQRLCVLTEFIRTASEIAYVFPSSPQIRLFLETSLRPLSIHYCSIYSKSHSHKKAIQFNHQICLKSSALCQIDDGRFFVVSSTLDDLMAIVIDPELGCASDIVFKELCITHQCFTTSIAVLEKFFKRLRVGPKHGLVFGDHATYLHELYYTRVRTFHLLIQWVSFHKEPDDGFFQLLVSFLTSMEIVAPEEKSIINSILQSLRNSNPKSLNPSFSLQLPLQTNNDILFKSQFVRSAAKQLCILDFELYTSIPTLDLLSLDKAKVETKIAWWTSRFNRLSNWATSVILHGTTPAARSKSLRILIKLATECLYHKNFNASYAILSGLNQSSISRLSKLWESISVALLTRFKELETIFAFQGGYKTYRSALKQVVPPAIPFLGVFTKDIFLLMQHNPTFNMDNTINFQKFTSITNICSQLVHFQATPYDFEGEPMSNATKIYFRSVFDSLPQNEDYLFELSIKIEPTKEVQQQENPLFGKIITSRGKKDLKTTVHYSTNDRGETVKTTLNPISNHPKLRMSRERCLSRSAPLVPLKKENRRSLFRGLRRTREKL